MPPPLEQGKNDGIVVENNGARSSNDAPTYTQNGSRPPTSYLDALIARPAVRTIPWSADKELPPAKAELSPRYQVRGACLLAMRGNVIEPKCTSCALPQSRFSLCIALPDWFQGSCAGCTMKSKPAQCSLCHDANLVSGRHSQIDDEIEPGTPNDHEQANEGDDDQCDDNDANDANDDDYDEISRYDNSIPDPGAANTVAYQAFQSRPDGIAEFERRGDTYYIYIGEVYCRAARDLDYDGEIVLCDTTNRFSDKKRLMAHLKAHHRAEWEKIQVIGMNKPGKKSYVEKNAAEVHFGYQLQLITQAASKGNGDTAKEPRQLEAATESSRKRKRSSEETPRDRSSSVDSSLDNDDSSALFNYVKDRERLTSRRHFNLPSNSRPITQEESGNGTDIGTSGFSTSGIAYQSQMVDPMRDNQRYPCLECKDGKIFSRQDNLSRHIKLAHPINNQDVGEESDESLEEEIAEPAHQISAASQPGHRQLPAKQPEHPPEPLIDTLPRSKQRQIYGIMSGVQGGINQLQRELDNLKKVLGIQDDD
ncbi:hypothetical protein PVAG01_10097 [Phlyctema vagabunda]|uniref:C2H2-type domain-containing protein n=1 Tax=Phlyctema vagabunda TaxID=108571 RepID=A0ABR4P4Z7_9HELO